MMVRRRALSASCYGVLFLILFVIGSRAGDIEQDREVKSDAKFPLSDAQLRGYGQDAKVGEVNRLQTSIRSHTRTATGGFARKVLMCLSFLAFVGNGAFMVFVFWM